MRKLIFLLLLPAALLAQREPVLKQIDLPHPYYYREMYLPQLTSGPSWVTWSPDSKSVIYSMAGSLWRQKIDSTEAVQLTDGPGYDYQPDWSHDGKYVVYTKYDHDALELWLLDLAGGKSSQLTKGGDVNVEPRWSPDGKRIVYVSTAGTKHFHIWLMDVRAGVVDGKDAKPDPVAPFFATVILSNRQLTKENASTLPRYYYSKFDHEISPAWSPDGKDIIFISNHGHIHGTGGIWRATVPESGMIDTNTNAKEIHYEETNWKARPEFSPDGKRIVYASYLGRQWHQLWLMPANGGDVFPLTYGDYDNINPRWSPDGNNLAFISNKAGYTQLFIKQLNGAGLTLELGTSAIRTYIKKRSKQLFQLDPNFPALRVSIQEEDGKYYAPPKTLVHADDSLDSRRQKGEIRYFYPDHDFFLELPQQRYTVCMTSGFWLHRCDQMQLDDHAAFPLSLSLRGGEGRPDFLRDWVSADLHVHSNYGGTYWMDSPRVGSEMKAEQLDYIFDLVVNKEQRFPNIARAEELEKLGWPLLAQEFHTSYWGHLGILNVDHLIIPGYAVYPNTAAASLVPMNADVADLAHAQDRNALVGWVHPFDELPDPYKDAKLTNELPIDVALGKIDYYEVLGFSDHKSSAAIWYRLLNLGFHLPAGAGTDAMMNFASLRGPVGLNRVFIQRDPRRVVEPHTLDMPDKNELGEQLKAGHTFATNGPLLRFSLGGQPIGGEVKLEKPGEVKFTAALRSIVPVDKVEVVCDGEVLWTVFPGTEAAQAGKASPQARVKDSQGHPAAISFDVSAPIPIAKSGWCVLRAYSDHAEEPIMDIYPYGTTSPIYVTVAGEKPRSPDDAKFFSKWIERVREDASVHPDYNTPQEREHVLKVLEEAAGVYQRMQEAGGRK
jgi:TolB protein